MLQFLVKFLIPCCLLLSAGAVAQTAGNSVFVERYTTENGLTHGHVYQVFQDSRGFIWLVTGNALLLYDGTVFMPLMNWDIIKSPGDIRLLFEDRAGRIWLQKNHHNFYLIDVRSFVITELEMELGDKMPEKIVNISQGTDGIISIISIAKGLYRYNCISRETSFVPLELDTDLFVEGDGDHFWFYRENIKTGLNITECLNVSDLQIKKLDLNVQGRLRVLSNGRIGAIGTEDLIILNSDTSIFRKNIRRYERCRSCNIVLINCTSPLETEEHGRYCWVYFQDRLLRVNIVDDVVEDFTVKHGLSSLPTVFDVLKDRQGNYWIATADGLIKTGTVPVRFFRYFWEDTEKLKIAPKNSCRGMTQTHNGDIYLGISKELYRKRRNDASFSKVASLGMAVIGMKVSASQNTVWLGSGNLVRYDIEKKKASIIEKPESVKSGEIWSIYEEKDKVWLGYSTDFLFVDKSNDSINRYYSPGYTDELSGTDIYQIVRVYNQDSLWLATSKGLFLLNRERRIAGRYATHSDSPVRFPCDNIRHVNQTAPDQVWMASSCGLISWHPQTGGISLISTQEGLPNSNLYAVYPDDFGFLWISSDMGIIQYHIASGRIRHFTAREGVTSNEFNRISHLKADNGDIYFGSINGVTVFNPAQFSDDFFRDNSAALVLMEAHAQGPGLDETVDLLPQYIQSGRIKIQPEERFIKLHFALPNYNTAGPANYYYKIEGILDSWQQVETPDVVFPQLPAGKYTLYIRTGSLSGATSAEPLKISIEVMPYFYEENWFYVLIIVLIIALVAVAWRIRVRYLIGRQQELEGRIEQATRKILEDKDLIEMQMNRIANISEEKSRFFVNITHELRTPLTLVTAPLEELQRRKLSAKREADLVATAIRNSQQLLLLVNDLLQLSKDEHFSSVNLNHPVELVPLIEDVIRLHTFGATQKGVKFHFVRGNIENNVVKGEEKLIMRVLTNIVSNAVKYSDGNGKIVITINRLENKLTVSVADNGRGIHPVDLPHIFERYYQTQRIDSPVEGGTGIGLSIAKEIMEACGGKIRVESEFGNGSVFFLDFPIIENRTDITVSQSKPVTGTNELVSVGIIRKRRIIIIDDNPEIVKFLKDMLDDDFAVSDFYTAENLLKSLSKNALPDLIICDLMMPFMDGFQLIRDIRKTKAYDKIKILVLTAMTSNDTGKRLELPGADDILMKPFSTDLLKKKILGLLLDTMPPDSIRINIPVATNLSDEQERWLYKLNHLIISQLTESSFSVDKLAEDMRFSRSTFFRELGRLTSLTPNEYIQEIRIEYARIILEAGDVASFPELLDRIGMKDKVYFSKMYKIRFGKSPRSYFA